MTKIITHRLLLLIYFCAQLNVFALAQMSNWKFEYFSTDQGLSSNEILQVIQDSDDYIWVATSEGLNRYNGFYFSKYIHDENDSCSISSGEILSFKEKGDFIWMGTNNGILNKYNKITGCFKKYHVKKDGEKWNHAVWVIDFRNDSIIWLALERGIAKFNINTEKFKIFLPTEYNENEFSIQNDVIYNLKIDKNNSNRIFLGTRDGLLVFNTVTNSFTPSDIYENKLVIRDIFQENDSLLWLATHNSGIVKINLKAKKYFSYKLDNSRKYSTINFIRKKSKNEYWVGFFDYGLAIFNSENKHFSFFQDIPYKYLNYPMANCRGYFKTKNSSYWFGANDGLYVSTKNSRNFKHYFLKNKNVERPIFFFIEDLMELNSELYLITLSSGRLPVIIDKSSGKILHRLSFSNSILNPDSPINFKLLLKDDKERIWLTSDHGLYQINLRNYKIEIPKIKINEDISRLNFYHIIKDLNNNIFISAHNPAGLLMINAEGDSATLYKKYFKDNKILNITDLNINKKGELFLFSEPFSFKFDINSKRFRRIGKGEKTNVLNHEWIRCGITDKDNVLFGYEGIGMIVFQENQDSIIKISKDNNIQSNRIYEFEKDDNGNIWAATGLGLIVLRPDTYQFVMSLNQKDGLIENNLGMYWGSAFKKLLSGDMFIGGHGFFTIFNPDSVLQKDIHVFKLKLESLTINGKVKHFDKIIDKKERIILNHNENDLLFEFANLDFNKKSNQKYKYRLIGYDDKWHLTTQNQLTFNKIPPGKYKLELGLVDGSGIKSLSIDVIPSWWQTWWFKLLLVIFLLGIVYFFISKRIEYIKDKEKLKSKYERKMLETEMKMLQSQMNSHFLFNTLNSIKNYIIKNETREAANYLTTFSGLIRNILNNSSQKFISLQSELEALEQYLNLELLRFDNKFKYEILIDDTIDVATVKVPPLLLQPFVENAIWHGLLHKDKKGKITIEIKKEKNQIKYIITDNGIGRKQAESLKSKSALNKKTYGLKLSKERLELLKNINGIKIKLDIIDLYNEQEIASGTKVVVILEKG